MIPAIHAAVNTADVQALLGAKIRFWAFGNAPDKPAKPYAVWQTAYGAPQNYLNQVPDIDNLGTQVDVYADSQDEAIAVAQALRDAIEPHAHITALRGMGRDPVTKNWRMSFDCDFWTDR